MKRLLKMGLLSHILVMCLLFMVSNLSMAKGFKIGVSLLTRSHPFYLLVSDGIKDKSEQLGIDVVVSVADQDLAKQVNAVDNFIIQKVDAIIISPVDSKGIKGALAKAKEAHIPVFTVDIKADDESIISHVGTDNYGGGLLAGKLMAKELKGKGNLAIIDYPGIASVQNRISGFKDAVSKYKDIKVVAIQAGITRAKALATTQNILQAHPDLDGIFGFGDDMAIAATIAVHQVKSHAIVVGFDGLEEARNLVDKDKTFVGVIQQYPHKMGEKVVDVAVQYLQGNKVQKEYPILPGTYLPKK